MELNLNVVVVTQARLGSTRLPNKVLKLIKGKSLLEIQIDRIKKAKQINSIYIATTVNKRDKKIEELADKMNIYSFRGSEEDVLDRFYQTLKNIKPDFIVRLTSDNPLIDPKLLDEVIIEAKKKKLDYYSNTLDAKYPDGQDIEVFTFCALENAWENSKLNSDREHVTTYIINNSSYFGGNIFTSNNHDIKENYSSVRLTVDEPEDLEVVSQLILNLGFNKSWKEYSDYYLKNTNISSLNITIKRNEGLLKSLKDNL